MIQETDNSETRDPSELNEDICSVQFVQYSYPDPDNAAVIEMADTEEEAKREGANGCPWYKYDVEPSDNPEHTGVLTNRQGPFFF
jgi:hypothetical protein